MIMKNIIYVLFAAVLFAGCSHTLGGGDGRTKIPAESLGGRYYAAYTLYVDEVKSFSSRENYFTITPDIENNAIKSIWFRTHLYDAFNSSTGQYKVIPSPGDLYIVMAEGSIPVNGKPYDANFDGGFTAKILFYGEDEATMYNDTKTVKNVPVSMKGWMKEKSYDPNWGGTSYDCEITIEFTVADVDYKIVITETRPIYFSTDGWFY